MALAILRLACENQIGQASQLGGIARGPGREHFTGKRPVAFQSEQKIGCSRSVMPGAEDFVLIFL